MENLTHSLLGATIAEAALPAGATQAQRRIFYVTGILAANLPDADLLYTRITAPPLGYLLHHRGHTHTLIGLVGLAALIAVAVTFPRIRRQLAGLTGRFWMLVAAALLSHIVADSWNSYGVHPFYPLDNRWYYGDAVYILEPWLWTVLGASVAMNTRSRRGRAMLAGLFIVLPVIASLVGVIAWMAVVPLAIVGFALVLLMRKQSPSSRSWISLAAAATFVGLSFATGRVLRSRIVDELGSRTVVDVVMNPRPANPLCWTAMAMERRGDTLSMRRREVGIGGGCGREPDGWTPVAEQSVEALRRAAASCDVRGWLQFGRAPVLSAGWIADARFGSAERGNFSAMPVAPNRSRRECPANLTRWDLPRADVLLPLPPADAAQ